MSVTQFAFVAEQRPALAFGLDADVGERSLLMVGAVERQSAYYWVFKHFKKMVNYKYQSF